MTNLEKNIENYFQSELSEIGKPINPTTKQVYRFENIEVSVQLLFQLLNKSENIEEATLKRVGDNFYNHCQKIVDFDVNELPNAIEGLATNYEPFLKLIAYLKHGQSEIWEPDDQSHSAGISKTTLYNLITGKINNKYKTPPGVPLKNIPEPLIEYRGMKRTILDFVRKELRNGVHNAKPYSRMELLHFSNIVLSCYVFAIEDNLLFLKKSFLEEFRYLESVVAKKYYFNLNKVYVDLVGHENSQEINDAAALQQKFDLLSDIEDFSTDTTDDELNGIEQEKRTDSILKIASDTLHFEIIGQGGAGKTTTLEKILFNNAKEILDGNSDLRIPFLIKANDYSPTNNFIKILSSKMNEKWVKNALKKGKLQILIDGLNEITENYKHEAYIEIRNLLKYYPENSIILTERKLARIIHKSKS